MPAKQQTEVTIFSSITNEWYTPSYIIEAARQTMGSIDLDPASNEVANKWIQATEYYSEEGIQKSWHGNVWVNPPFGKENGTKGKFNSILWSEKFLNEYSVGNMKQGILLTKTTFGYEWYERLVDAIPTICLLREKPKFVRLDGTTGGACKSGISLFYLGFRSLEFKEYYKEMGRFIK